LLTRAKLKKINKIKTTAHCKADILFVYIKIKTTEKLL